MGERKMSKFKVYEAFLHYPDGCVMSMPVRAKTEEEAKELILKLLLKEGTPDIYYNAWVRGDRQIVCEDDKC